MAVLYPHACYTEVYKVMINRKILIKYNVYLKKLYFTCENIKYNFFKGEIGCPLLSPLTSFFQTPITFLLVDKNTKCGYSFS